jgi:hypothetical protein
MLLSVQFVGIFYDAAFMCVAVHLRRAPVLSSLCSVEETLIGPTNWCDASVSLGFLAREQLLVSPS